MTDPDRSQHRRLRITRTVALLIGGGLFTAFAVKGFQAGNELGTAVSTVVAVFSFYFSLADRWRSLATLPQVDVAAEEFRMRLLELWEPEVRRRVQRSPHSQTIPLEWKARGQADVSAGPLDGRFEGDPHEAAEQLADAFHRLPGKKRLVVLGEPGSGKTFFALALTVGVLRKWTEGDPITVFLPISSWDPVVEELDDWIVGHIAHNHYGGDQRVPRTLLTAERLVPVLDGLDELPEHLRRPAVRQINEALIGNRAVVVTCRTTEYEEVLAGGSPDLLRAPAVEVQPVATADVVARLKDRPAWRKVLRHIENRPTGHVASALRTPLMLSFFTAAYQDRDPAELLDRKRFTSKHAVEDHLADLRLDTAFPSDPSRGQWSARKAKKWLTYLAQHMHDNDERTITWWQLTYRVAGASAFVVAIALSIGILWLDSKYLSNVVAPMLRSEALVTLVTGALGAALVLFIKREAPGRPNAGRRDRPGGFRRGFAVGAIPVLSFGVPMVVIVSSKTELASDDRIVQATALICAVLSLAIACGAVVGLHEAAAESSTSKRRGRAARDLLKLERTSTFLTVAVTGLVAGPLCLFAATIGTSFGARLGQWLAPSFDLATAADLRMPPLRTYVTWPLELGWLAEASLLIGVLFALLLAATRSWPRLLAVQVELTCAGRMPWRVNQFVAEATRRGLLRRAGLAYEFGHMLLQERLVSTAVSPPPLHRRRWLQIAVSAILTPLLIYVVVAAWSGKPQKCFGVDEAEIAGPAMRIKVGDDTACFATLEERDRRILEKTEADGPLLADISMQAGRKEVDAPLAFGALLITGDFHRIDSATWHETLRGLVAAKKISKGPLDIDFFFSDLEGNTGEDAAKLIQKYLVTLQYRIKDQDRAVTLFDVIGLDADKSGSSGNRRTLVEFIGLQDRDLLKYAEKRASDLASLRLNLVEPRSTPPTCADVERVKGLPYVIDLRRAGLSASTLADLARCGEVEVLVDPANAMELNALPNRPPEVTVHYVDTRSATVAQQCAQTLGTNDSNAESVRSCVAAVSLSSSFSVGVKQLPKPGSR